MAARLLALLGSGAAQPEPGPRRVPGTHLAESLERQHTAPARAAPLGPPPGLAPPDLTLALLAQLRQSAPCPQQWPQQAGWPQAQLPRGPGQWTPPWGGLLGPYQASAAPFQYNTDAFSAVPIGARPRCLEAVILTRRAQIY